MIKCLLLFSGGLDSILVAKILLEQKIKVVPICFKSYFFGCELAKKSVKQLKLKLKVVNFSEDQLKIVKNPHYGHGKGLNPCIDCHLLMIKEAKEIMLKKKFDFLATGEVLGERPFSQRKEILSLIEEEAGLEGKILRPLSAKLLAETFPEKEQLVNRKKLFAIQGKSRRPQMALAKKFGIKYFPNPSGGCLLTDPEYSKKLKELFKKVPSFDGNDAQILKKGRISWLARNASPASQAEMRYVDWRSDASGENTFLLVVGRNENENKELKKLKKKRDKVLDPKNFPGPTVLVRGFGGKIRKEILNKAKALLIKYSKKLPKSPKINEIDPSSTTSINISIGRRVANRSCSAGFKDKVLKIVNEIKKGKVMTYKGVAIRAGKPKAWRAVGNILHKNENPKIPCHRVIRSNGKVGGYRKGEKNKITLLKKEGFKIQRNRVIF